MNKSIFKNYANYYNFLYQDKPYKKEAEFVYKWANKPKRILELGIGTGQHAKYWCKNSQITAIDNSKEMLKNAYQHPNIKYFLHSIENLNDFIYPLSDCAVALFNVMGYCLLEETLPYLPLTKDGYFIFDIWDASKFKKQPPQVKVKYFDMGYRVSIPHQISKRLLEIDFIIVDFNKIKVFERHLIQGYFREDIKQLCRLHNYKIADIKPTKTWNCWYKIQKIR